MRKFIPVEDVAREWMKDPERIAPLASPHRESGWKAVQCASLTAPYALRAGTCRHPTLRHRTILSTPENRKIDRSKGDGVARRTREPSCVIPCDEQSPTSSLSRKRQISP
jgi:hypothetical protein